LLNSQLEKHKSIITAPATNYFYSLFFLLIDPKARKVIDGAIAIGLYLS